MRRLPLSERVSAAASVLMTGAVPGRFGPLTPASEWNRLLSEAASDIHVDDVTALNMSAVYACVTTITDAVRGLPISVHQRDGDTRLSLPDHPVSKLFAGLVNDYGGRRNFVGAVEGDRQRGGNGLGQIQRDSNGTPVGLWRVSGASVKRNDAGALVYETSEGGERVTIPASDMLHVKAFSVDGGVTGISPIGCAARAISAGQQMERYGLDFFKNESKSGGFILHPGKLSETAKDNIVGSIKRQGDGKSPAGVVETSRRSHHNIKVLEEGAKWISTTIAPEEAQFLGSREFALSEIARFYRVPLVLLQSQQGSTVWGTGINSLLVAFTQLTITPLAESWSEELTLKLLTEEERAAGLYVMVDVRGLLRGDPTGRAAYYASGIQNGWLTPNDVRKLEDMNPIEEGDAPPASPRQ